ncbi:uncharacterized protein N7503_005740 [Penicillium pulvis]|uniref:uncharacterized protein n=1 Tax=Penicillium pulvis TaxID=1562058 RepID=UPI002546AB2B|nr:uncharacterized protein N7503_005740 [Penicillium pulvis]KAJ5803290.1 hypothetical protein N7503_005740 [Penicillium pulvis]
MWPSHRVLKNQQNRYCYRWFESRAPQKSMTGHHSAQSQIGTGISAHSGAAGLGHDRRIRDQKRPKTKLPHVCSTLHQLRLSPIRLIRKKS